MTHGQPVEESDRPGGRDHVIDADVFVNRLPPGGYAEAEFDECGFNLHSKTDHRSESVIVFIHGWNGKGYNAWLNFPRFLIEATQLDADIAVFRYDTGPLCAMKGRVDLLVSAERLKRGLESLAREYKSIYIMAHSLGGIMAQVAVRLYLIRTTHSQRRFTESIAGIFFFGSPRAGVGVTTVLPRWPLFPERRWLAPNSEQRAETEQFFEDSVVTTIVARPGEKAYVIPRLAVYGSADAIAKAFTARMGVAENLQCPLQLDHQELAKPTSRDSRQVTWVIGKIGEIAEVRAQREREESHSEGLAAEPVETPGRIITELWTGTGGSQWVSIYNEVRRSLSNNRVAVLDVSDCDRNGLPVDLLLSVHDAQKVVEQQESERHQFADVRKRHVSQTDLLVGVAPVGGDANQATQVMQGWLSAPRPYRHFYIEGVADKLALHDKFTGWVKLVAGGARADDLGLNTGDVSQMSGSILDFGKEPGHGR